LLETVENGKYTDSYWYGECCDQLNPFETSVTKSYVMLTSIIFFLLPFLLSPGLFIRWYDNNVLIRIESAYTSKIREGEIMMETEKLCKEIYANVFLPGERSSGISPSWLKAFISITYSRVFPIIMERLELNSKIFCHFLTKPSVINMPEAGGMH